MDVVWFEGATPLTKFAPKFKVPIGVGVSGSNGLVDRLTKYVLTLEETIISKEELVSPVPKSEADPYRHTQQWKQHNLLDDVVGLEGEHLERFPHDPAIEELFTVIRTGYLEFLSKLNYPRRKVYIHGWANVLRDSEWISKHRHITTEESYLACTYYLTTNKTSLYLENPLVGDVINVPTEEKKLIFFPSWMPHWSDKIEGDSIRISLAFDIVTESCTIKNPWRPHRLLDDPATMPGLEGLRNE